jgi:diguanylate cyclase (GGDEF)-like protein
VSSLLAWPTCVLSTLVGILTFALLDCSLGRMRSRDRLTAFAWWFGSACAVAGGFWATWALALAALDAATDRAPLRLDPSWLAALGLAAALAVTVLHALARQAWSESRRALGHVATVAGLWVAMFELARHSFSTGTAAAGQVAGLPTLPVSLAVVVAGALAAGWLAAHQRRRGVAATPGSQLRVAALLGLSHGGALLISVSTLRLPEAQERSQATSGATAEVGSPLLLFLGGLALALLLIGLLSAWLDTRAHRRNRTLTESLNEANLRLREQAHSDPLTRMPNRLMFEERMAEALDAAGPTPAPRSIAVLFIDLDGFKPINDSFGHVAGDAVLREIGRRLQAVARTEDTVARVGGDEFLLMIPRPGQDAAAAALAQRVLQSLGEPLTLPNNVAVNLSASIGIVMYPEHGPPSKLIANADAAMYAAKRAGGSTYAFFEPRMELDAREQLALQHDLRHAIERNELQLYYQPKIHAKSGQITGAEALLRWQHSQRGFVPPAIFIPVAERFGLIGVIGNWVITEACRQMRDWKQQGLRMRVAVNLSVHQLRQEDLVQRVRLAVTSFDIDAQLLTFEITESVAMEDTQETMRAFSQLASVGVSLSIDDFGTGYSSLSYLRKLPARQLKIDQSFVQDLGTSPDALAVVDAVIKLAHALGLQVVAEGVETTRQRDILLGLQCDELQGYLFAKPMAARMLTLWAMGDTHAGARVAVDAPRHEDFRPSLYDECGPDTVVDMLQ